MALACVLVLDLARRALDLPYWYTNEGLLPNHTVLWSPPFEWQFSFFFTASYPWEAVAWMLACGAAYVLLLVGYRTRVAQVLSLAAVLSLHTRASFVGNGGDVVLGELALWTAFLPSGRRYSLDALLARPRTAAPSTDAEPLGDARNAPVVSFAVLALTLQLVAIYVFNALNKTGPTWREGSVVHYMLHQDNIVTALGLWVRGFLTPGQSRVMTYLAWSMEFLLPVLLLTPFGRRYARSLAVVLVLLLHGGFGLFLNLGVFVPAMMAFGLHFVPKEAMDALERAVGRRLASARLAKLVERLASSRFFAARRSAPSTRPSARLGEKWGLVREGGVLILLGALGAQAAFDNPAVTKANGDAEPTVIRAIASYLQALQAWGMYAPDAPTTDANVSVEAITADGRHVDPFNEIASPRAPRPQISIPARLDQDNLFYAYALRLPSSPNYHQAFTEWILRYPERTGRPSDRIVSFEAFLVEDDSPPPGSREPKNAHASRFLRYPEQ